ncbi:MAG: hypothetical protein GC179_31225 [Anaerolineaceae bacterium]|nr:hypothetical protein [Anaerolineaceae bacterium]
MLTDLDYELLSAYIDDALSDSERTAFELRLQAEPELRSELDELRATVTLLNNLPVLKAPRDFTLDARYARRSSIFFTSATFSALSTAAAIILFALGAYVLTLNKAPAPASEPLLGQAAQSAFVGTATASSLDKAAASTATEAQALNEVEVQTATGTTLDSPVVPSDGLAANDSVGLATATVQPTSLPDQSPLFHTDAAQATDMNGEVGDASASSAGAAPSEMQQRMEMTLTFTGQEAASPSSDGAVSVPPAPSMAQAVPSTLVNEAEANTGTGFAATQLPMTVTAVPSIRSTPTATLAPTLTRTPTVTMSSTPVPTETVTPSPTVVPLASQPEFYGTDMTSLVLMVLGGILLLVGIVTTVIRRRNNA